MSDYREVKACRLCDSLELTAALDFGETPLANELDGTELFPLMVMRCDACGHHQLSIAVAPERLWGPSYPYQSGTSPVFRKHLEALADEVAALKPGGRVLEIAANDGTLVYALQERKMLAIGVDPSSRAPGIISSSWPCGLYKEEGQPFDCIIALNVFAHVDDLHGFTVAIKEALAPDGVFILEVGYLLDVIERGLFDVIYHEHMSYHHVAPLAAFFERHGLRIEKVQHIDSQGGSVRLYVKHASEVPWYDARGEETPQVASLRPRIETMRAGIEAALISTGIVDAGTVDGYGCPAKLTTLVYAGELPLVDCVYDDNPLKVGKRVPGKWARILPTADLMARNPDTLVLFSWNFAEEIIPRLRAIGYRGRIVVPLPEVKVYECL